MKLDFKETVKFTHVFQDLLIVFKTYIEVPTALAGCL